MIRKAEPKDLSRIAEIMVFTKRIKYRSIFHNDKYSFNELQVVKVVDEFRNPELLGKVWIYDDGIVKGMIHLEGKEIVGLKADDGQKTYWTIYVNGEYGQYGADSQPVNDGDAYALKLESYE